MARIVGSWLIKAHLHLAEDGLFLQGSGIRPRPSSAPSRTRGDDPAIAEKVANGETFEAPTNEAIKDTIIDALQEEFGGEVTVSLIERTDD